MVTKIHLILILLFICSLAYSQSVTELIEQNDDYIEVKFDNINALKTIEQAYSLKPNNFEVLWRISRAYVDFGEHLPDKTDNDKREQLKHFEKALDFANKSINISPENMIGYLQRAIANGKIALFKGVFKSISLVNSVKKDLELAIKLKNGGDIHQSVAHYVLARAHSEVCNKPYLLRLPLSLGWGDRDVAAENFDIAIKIRSNFIMFRLDAARNYIEMDEYQKAKEHLNVISSLPKLDEDDDTYRTEAKKLLEEIKNK